MYLTACLYCAARSPPGRERDASTLRGDNFDLLPQDPARCRGWRMHRLSVLATHLGSPVARQTSQPRWGLKKYRWKLGTHEAWKNVDNGTGDACTTRRTSNVSSTTVRTMRERASRVGAKQRGQGIPSRSAARVGHRRRTSDCRSR